MSLGTWWAYCFQENCKTLLYEKIFTPPTMDAALPGPLFCIKFKCNLENERRHEFPILLEECR